MTVIFDLDYTLLDTAAFKEELVRALVACGASREAVISSYTDVVTRPGVVYDYDPDLQLEQLADELKKCDSIEAHRRLAAVAAQAGEFLYPGAASLLEKLKRFGAQLVLLTLGNPKWQAAKMAGSGLAGYFDRVIISDRDKADAVREATGGDTDVTVINDNGEEIDAMRRVAPNFRYILKRGPKSSSVDQGVPVAATFADVERLIFT